MSALDPALVPENRVLPRVKRSVAGGGLLLVFALTRLAYGGTPSGEIKSVAVSPDGRVVAVEFQKDSNSFIYKIPVDTGIATRLTDAEHGEESSPAFSADGKKIAYTYWPGRGSRSRIVIANVDGSDRRQWSPSGSNDFSPVLAPDNKTIVFSRSEYSASYSPIAQPHGHAWSFYTSDLDGTNIRVLTKESFYAVSSASISPDGKSMVVVTESLDAPAQIVIYSLDHGGQPLASLRPRVPKEADHKNPILAYPNYMSDGKSILFMAASNGKHGYDYDIYRVEVGTGSLERLTNGNGYATDLKLSADGTTAIFLKWHKNWLGNLAGSELYLLDMQSRKMKPLKVSGLD